MIKNDKEGMAQCLAASLTILVKKGLIDEDFTNEVIKTKGLAGLYNLLNDVFKDEFKEELPSENCTEI